MYSIKTRIIMGCVIGFLGLLFAISSRIIEVREGLKWNRTDGVLETIKPIQRGDGNGNMYYRVSAWYTYSVGGHKYKGEYYGDDSSEQDNTLKELESIVHAQEKRNNIYVYHRIDKPSVSTLNPQKAGFGMSESAKMIALSLAGIFFAFGALTRVKSTRIQTWVMAAACMVGYGLGLLIGQADDWSWRYTFDLVFWVCFLLGTFGAYYSTSRP